MVREGASPVAPTSQCPASPQMLSSWCPRFCSGNTLPIKWKGPERKAVVTQFLITMAPRGPDALQAWSQPPGGGQLPPKQPPC